MSQAMNDKSQTVIDSLVAGRQSEDLATATGPVVERSGVTKPPKSAQSFAPSRAGSLLILKCVLWAFSITAVAWLLTIPAWNKGETAYAWIVCVPLYMSVFLPGSLVWHCLQSSLMLGSSMETSGLIVTTLLINSTFGLAIGFLIQRIKNFRRNITKG